MSNKHTSQPSSHQRLCLRGRCLSHFHAWHPGVPEHQWMRPAPSQVDSLPHLPNLGAMCVPPLISLSLRWEQPWYITFSCLQVTRNLLPRFPTYFPGCFWIKSLLNPHSKEKAYNLSKGMWEPTKQKREPMAPPVHRTGCCWTPCRHQ